MVIIVLSPNEQPICRAENFTRLSRAFCMLPAYAGAD
jgi:hypothetical protein